MAREGEGMRRGKAPGPLALSIHALAVGEHVMVSTERERNTAYMAAYRIGVKLEILATNKGRWRVERIA